MAAFSPLQMSSGGRGDPNLVRDFVTCIEFIVCSREPCT